MTDRQYDCAVLGSRAAGLTAALTAAEHGAKVLVIPADALEATVARWNRMIETGKDEDFGRGESYYDLYWDDPAHTGRKQATLGTKSGPKTDTLGRVLDVDLHPIEGLYAAGNAMGSMMGMAYGGGGGTLGPGMVFGYLAGKHAAQRNVATQRAAEAVG